MMKPLHNETDAAALPSRNLGRHLLRCCAFCLALAVSVPASAQWRVGLTAGYSRNTLDMDTGYAYDLRYEARDGFTVGIPVQYDFRDWFGLRADLVFVQKGQKMHRTDTYNAIHTDTRNNYLQLPVMASFSFGGERLRGFLKCGRLRRRLAVEPPEGRDASILLGRKRQQKRGCRPGEPL